MATVTGECVGPSASCSHLRVVAKQYNFVPDVKAVMLCH